MALLDISDVLCDPDFMDTGLVCVRNTQTVGTDGLATNTPVSIPFAGVVTNDSGNILERIAEGQRNKDSITIHTQFILMDGGAAQDADIVQWRGKQYTVSNVQDWSHFGAGFTCATCDLIPLAG